MLSFADKLNQRREENAGANPYIDGYIQVPFGPVNYKGVKAVSDKFMLDIYPDQDIRLVMGMFTTLGLDKVVFDKFILRIFMYGNKDREITEGLIRVMCDDADLAERIYTQWSKAHSTVIGNALVHNPYRGDSEQ